MGDDGATGTLFCDSTDERLVDDGEVEREADDVEVRLEKRLKLFFLSPVGGLDRTAGAGDEGTGRLEMRVGTVAFLIGRSKSRGAMVVDG